MLFKRTDEDKARRVQEAARRKARKAHETELARARVKVKRLESEHRLAVREAERKLKAAEGKPLAALEKASDFFGPSLKVYPDRVETPKGSHPLTTDLSARVEGSGRSLVVLIEGSDWGYTHDPHPDNTNKAHDFAREFNLIIRTLPIEDSDAVKTARTTLEQVRKDRSKIEEAETELRDLEAQTPA